MSPKEVVIEFNNSINKQDIDGLERLMTDSHIFIDSENNEVEGKADCLDAWRGFFHHFPDYKNHFQDIKTNNDLVIIVGYSTCSKPIMDGPAIWTAKVKNSKVGEWRVYEDTDRNRQLLGLSDR